MSTKKKMIELQNQLNELDARVEMHERVFIAAGVVAGIEYVILPITKSVVSRICNKIETKQDKKTTPPKDKATSEPKQESKVEEDEE